MTGSEMERLNRKEHADSRKKRADSFWGAFLLTENGRVKSTLLLNSFCLSIVFGAVYAAAFIFLVDPLHALMDGAGIFWTNLVESLVPAVAGTGICSISWLIFKEKRMMATAYAWLLVFAFACFVTVMMLFGSDVPEAKTMFLQVFMMLVPAPILTGGILSVFLYCRYLKQREPLSRDEL